MQEKAKFAAAIVVFVARLVCLRNEALLKANVFYLVNRNYHTIYVMRID